MAPVTGLTPAIWFSPAFSPKNTDWLTALNSSAPGVAAREADTFEKPGIDKVPLKVAPSDDIFPSADISPSTLTLSFNAEVPSTVRLVTVILGAPLNPVDVPVKVPVSVFAIMFPLALIFADAVMFGLVILLKEKV